MTHRSYRTLRKHSDISMFFQKVMVANKLLAHETTPLPGISKSPSTILQAFSKDILHPKLTDQEWRALTERIQQITPEEIEAAETLPTPKIEFSHVVYFRLTAEIKKIEAEQSNPTPPSPSSPLSPVIAEKFPLPPRKPSTLGLLVVVPPAVKPKPIKTKKVKVTKIETEYAQLSAALQSLQQSPEIFQFAVCCAYKLSSDPASNLLNNTTRKTDIPRNVRNAWTNFRKMRKILMQSKLVQHTPDFSTHKHDETIPFAIVDTTIHARPNVARFKELAPILKLIAKITASGETFDEARFLEAVTDLSFQRKDKRRVDILRTLNMMIDTHAEIFCPDKGFMKADAWELETVIALRDRVAELRALAQPCPVPAESAQLTAAPAGLVLFSPEHQAPTGTKKAAAPSPGAHKDAEDSDTSKRKLKSA